MEDSSLKGAIRMLGSTEAPVEFGPQGFPVCVCVCVCFGGVLFFKGFFQWHSIVQCDYFGNIFSTTEVKDNYLFLPA